MNETKRAPTETPRNLVATDARRGPAAGHGRRGKQYAREAKACDGSVSAPRADKQPVHVLGLNVASSARDCVAVPQPRALAMPLHRLAVDD